MYFNYFYFYFIFLINDEIYHVQDIYYSEFIIETIFNYSYLN